MPGKIVSWTMKAYNKDVVRAYTEVASAERKAERGAKRLSKTSGDVSSRMGADLSSIINRFVGIGAAIGAVHKAFGAWREDLAKTISQVDELSVAARNLLFMSTTMRGGPGGTPVVTQVYREKAVKLHVDAAELMKGEELARSMLPYASEERIQAIIREMAEYRQTVEVPLPEMAPMFAKLENVFGRREGLTANELQNIVKYTAEKASAEPRELIAYLPRALSAARKGGLTAREAAALFAVTTVESGTPRKASGGIEQFIPELMSTATPAQQQIARMAKFDKQDNALTRMEKLSEIMASGKLSPIQLEKAFGSGAREMSTIIEDWESTTKMLDLFRRDTRRGVDVTADQLAARKATDKEFVAILERDNQRRKEEAARGTRAVESLTAETVLSEIETRGLERGQSAFWRGVNRGVAEVELWLGAEPEGIRRRFQGPAPYIPRADETAGRFQLTGKGPISVESMDRNTEALNRLADKLEGNKIRAGTPAPVGTTVAGNE